MKWKVIIGLVVGASAGFVLGYFGQCSSPGAAGCAMMSNPWSGMAIGALLGYAVMQH